MPAIQTKEWKYKKLSEICDFKGGGIPSKQEKSFWNGNIPWASVKDIKGSFLENTQDKISILGLNNSAASLAKPGDLILITRISPGKSAISKIEVAINQDLKIVTPKSKTSPKFLHYFFQSIERKIQDLSSGTTVLGITLNTLNEIQIPDITYDIQLAIVSKIEELFSELDKGIESLRIAQQQLKVYRQSVLKWAFEGRLTNEDVKEGEWPDGWKIIELGKLCKTTSGGTPNRKYPKYYSGNIPWVKSGELAKGTIFDTEEKITQEAVDNSSAKIFPKGTLLIALYGATIGKLGFLGVAAATNQAICGILENQDVNSQYLYYFLDYKKQFLVEQGIGGAQPNISQTILKNLEITLAPINEQSLIVYEIEDKFSVLEKMEETIIQSLQQAVVMRHSILKRAYEGKLINSTFNIKN